MSKDKAQTKASAEITQGEPESAEEAARIKARNRALLIGCIGVVYGDIGTSPLYAFREAARRVSGEGILPAEIYGILSLILWALIIIVTLKYVLLLLRVDNKGVVIEMMAMASAVAHRLISAQRTARFCNSPSTL